MVCNWSRFSFKKVIWKLCFHYIHFGKTWMITGLLKFRGNLTIFLRLIIVNYRSSDFHFLIQRQHNMEKMLEHEIIDYFFPFKVWFESAGSCQWFADELLDTNQWNDLMSYLIYTYSVHQFAIIFVIGEHQ